MKFFALSMLAAFAASTELEAEYSAVNTYSYNAAPGYGNSYNHHASTPTKSYGYDHKAASHTSHN